MTAPVEVATRVLDPHLSRFLAQHPDVKLPNPRAAPLLPGPRAGRVARARDARAAVWL